MNQARKDVNFLNGETHQIFHRLIESLTVGVFLADTNGKIVYTNPAFANILGYNTKHDLIDRHLTEELFLNPEDHEVFSDKMSKFGFVRDQEVRNRNKDGQKMVLSVSSNFIHNESGDVVGIEGVIHDITAKKQLEDRLEIEKTKLEEILIFDQRISAIHDLNQLIDFIVQKSSDILEAEKCSLMLLNEQTKELFIKSAKGLSPEIIERTRVKLGQPIAGYVAEQRKAVLSSNIEYDRLFARKNRPGYSTRSFLSAPIQINQHTIGVINLADKKANGIKEFSDIDLKILGAIVREAAVAFDNAKLYKELEQLSVIDPLTKICNYRCFIKNLDHEIQRVKRLGGKLSILMMDVDGFKNINDTCGHLGGDEALQLVAQVLQKNLRSIDQVSRYGGDEFAVILPGADREQAKIVAEKIRQNVETLSFKEPLSVSIGIAEYHSRFDRMELISRADQAMYRAKHEGKNLVRSYEEDPSVGT